MRLVDKFTFDIESWLFEEVSNEKIKRVIVLNKPAVKSYKIGNYLTIKEKDRERELQIKISNLYYFDTIMESLTFLDQKTLGFGGRVPRTKIEDYLLRKYSAEDVSKYGVAVIEFDKI